MISPKGTPITDAPWHGMLPRDYTSDGLFRQGRDGVRRIMATKDHKVEFVQWDEHTLAHVTSSLSYPAYYPLHPARLDQPPVAVLMDLDGTSVRSEQFWIWIIEKTTGSLRHDPQFKLEPEDGAYVSGHSVSEHLQYCIRKYSPKSTLEDARAWYFEHTRREMKAILEGQGRAGAFEPVRGLKEFLLTLKARGIRVALVTSGLYEKAWPEIVSAFQTIGLGDPKEFYDAIITAGEPLGRGRVGTLGELAPKPHPWLYAEAARIGLGIPFERRHQVVGLEDSGAGIVSVRLAGFAAIGLAGGNIEESGTEALCHRCCADLEEVLRMIL